MSVMGSMAFMGASCKVWVRREMGVNIGSSDVRGRIADSYYGFDYRLWFSYTHPVISPLVLSPNDNSVIALCTPSVLDALRRMK